MKYKSSHIADLLQCEASVVNDYTIETISIDSRSVIMPEKTLFFALKGVHHNGESFVEALYKMGVRNFVVGADFVVSDKWGEANFFKTSSPLSALQTLAQYHRHTFVMPVIAITGSNGKTIVKEWLAQVLEDETDFYRSPRSYNSQVGVPLAILGMEQHHELAILEAGISMPGEMLGLQRMIDPEIGIFTHLGDAHDENFTSRDEKLKEKAQLFKNVRVLIGEESKQLQIIKSLIGNPTLQVWSWSATPNLDALIKVDSNITTGGRELDITYNGQRFQVGIPFKDTASFHNAMNVIAFMLYRGMKMDTITSKMAQLQSIAMRMEIKGGTGGAVLIHDYYNSDLDSFKIALDVLRSQDSGKEKTVILSDFIGIGNNKEEIYRQVSTLLAQAEVTHFLGIGKELSKYHYLFSHLNARFYNDVASFLATETRGYYAGKAILLKGARAFKFEHIASFLQKQSHTTMLEVNMDAMVANLNYFRALIPKEVKTAVMVKAFSYGSGSGEVASLLQYHGVDYLMVAYVDEGVTLRKSGISVPIAVMNPELEAIDDLIEYQLEPEIYSMDLLYAFNNVLKQRGLMNYPVHVKLNTGMNRSGVDSSELDELIEFLGTREHMHIKSVFSHLAGSDDPALDWFTHQQLDLFDEMFNRIATALGYNPLKHILNSAGIERFPAYHYDMVRLGIGLHGLSAVGASLKPVSRFKTYIVSIRNVPKEQSVGYGRKGILTHDARIAVIPVGYADGWNRHLSCGVGQVYVGGHRVLIVGNICMDACMIDVTNVDVNVGDEVELFGPEIKVEEVACWIDTIAYEVLTSVSPRVKRVYYKE
ncbi:MAG: bifunctional UDP-N-acetylmuramoyl-tripeptide:D-alanyl-D-alanine ligase/alanine racemase [Marinifilaceae bacterium]